MPGLRVRLFGRTSVEVNGRPAELTPTTTAVLIRLLVAEGAPVTVDEIVRDVWSESRRVKRLDRTKVQRRILEIRETVDPDYPGEKSRVLLTERGLITGYRLVLAREAVDVLAFADLAARARRAGLDEKITLLGRAMDLWRGAPLADVSDQHWAAPTVRRLTALRQRVMRELMEAYEAVGRGYDALEAGEKLSLELSDDNALTVSLAALREQLRVGQHKKVFRADFTDPDFAVVVTTGDLFAQDDANLVAGFCDTFDTDTDRNIIISAESAQGVLLRQLYDGDRGRLDRELRAALARVEKASVERRSDKPRGKLTRYPLGTVATLHHPTRRVFAVAYSRMGNDLVAQSTLPTLHASLENLWEAVYLHGQLKPVAMPLVGSGLSRTGGSYQDLLAMIVSSFVASSRARYFCPELRVVVHQDAFDKIRVAEVLKSVREVAAAADPCSAASECHAGTAASAQSPRPRAGQGAG
jgi:DNA-binding SARP family transcriptional activator